MMRPSHLALVVSACVIPTFARAEIIIGSSLEWLTCSADVVVVGHIEKIVTTRGPGDVFYDDCTVEVKEIIRGKVEGNRLVFCFRTLSPEYSARGWMKSPEPILFFLSKSKGHGSEKHPDGMFIPTSHQFPLSVIDLTAPDKYVLDTRFRVLTDRKEILDTCRKTAGRLANHLRSNPKGEVEVENLRVPPGSEAWRSLYAKSACFVRGPVFVAERQK